MKKIITIVLTVVLVVAFPLNIFAADQYENTQSGMDFVVYGGLAEATLEQNKAETLISAAGSFKPGIYFSRTSPTSKNVNMYFTISNCKDYSNAIKYKKVEICNTNLLNRKVYKTLAKNSPVTKNYTALKNGHILMASFDLPTSVEKVRVDWEYVYIYMLEYGWSTSARDPIGQFAIE